MLHDERHSSELYFCQETTAMTATTEQVPLNSAVIEERNAIRSGWSQSERERRRRLAIDMQNSLAELLLRNVTAVRTHAA